MRILYFYRVGLPSPRADAIQIVNTCAAMARQGAGVDLHVESLEEAGRARVLGYYGLDDPGGDGALAFRAMGTHWSWPLFPLRTAGLLRAAGRTGGCLFVREVRPYVPGLAARARRAGMKILFEAHNVSASLVREKQSRSGDTGGTGRKLRERERLESSILRLADALVCTQKATLDALAPSLPKEIPAAVIGNGSRPAPAVRAETKDIDVLYCGSLKAWKGVDSLVAAMQTLHPWVLTIVGPGTAEDIARLKQSALAQGVHGRVRILPPVGPSEVWSLYARAKVGVVPLPSESSVEARDFTSPLKLFEMMASGLPVVSTSLPSIREYLENGREALLVPPDDPRALAYGIRRILTEEPLRASLSAAATERAKEFTWEGRGRRILELIGRL
ncbi:MAG TPA: glycosyltransferase family 4 protein [Candidatus Saccharimonadales bacterium]|nr:glycosyltransferase family 4 protein [Candidatus Saccharimonadales bacterium]